MDRRATEGAYLIDFGGRCIDYRFVRRRRRTIGITIDADGLSVAAPLRAPWREVEAFRRQKERWIKRKLEEWARLPRPAIVRGHSGESLPLFGSTVTLEVQTGSRRAVRHQRQRLPVSAPPGPRVAKVVVGWPEDPGARLADAARRALRRPPRRRGAARRALERAYPVGRVHRGRHHPPVLAPGASRARARGLRGGSRGRASCRDEPLQALLGRSR